MAEPEISQPLRVTPERRCADDWALALSSAGIDSHIDWAAGGCVLSVRAADWQRADALIAAYEAENRLRPTQPPDALDQGVSYAAGVVAVLLCAFFVVTGSRDAGPYWFERGGAVASRIVAGEVWRTVTALTLHADFPHILGNAVTLIIFGTGLCGLVGAGVGVWLMLVSGAAGNWLTAALRGAPYDAVGASTGIFGAIGALAAIQLVRRRRGAGVSAWRAWAPIAAGLALLGFLGSAPESDVVAHLFGFAIGAALGIVALRAHPLRDRLALQSALSVAAALVVLACWLRALS